jgi:hypothetical protein
MRGSNCCRTTTSCMTECAVARSPQCYPPRVDEQLAIADATAQNFGVVRRPTAPHHDQYGPVAPYCCCTSTLALGANGLATGSFSDEGSSCATSGSAVPGLSRTICEAACGVALVGDSGGSCGSTRASFGNISPLGSCTGVEVMEPLAVTRGRLARSIAVIRWASMKTESSRRHLTDNVCSA